jgi:hypothetical protein
MAKSQAQKDAEVAEKAAQEAKEQLGENLEMQATGVVLDVNDPNFDQKKRLEDLRIEVQKAQAEAITVGQDAEADVVKAGLDAEEARLKAELAAAQQAATQEAASAGVANVLDQLTARAEAEKAREQAVTSNDQSGS